MKTVTCNCGAVYAEEKHKLIMRDKDRKDCGLCGATLNSWNGAVMFTYKLIQSPDDHDVNTLAKSIVDRATRD